MGSSVRNNKSIDNKDVYSFVLKKTEKLVAALYMVTDCMDTDDAIKMKMRLRGVDVLSAVHQISVLSPVEKHTHLTSVRLQINEIISLVDISSTIGFISEMNARILRREFEVLIQELELHQGKIEGAEDGKERFENRKISEFILSEEMFKIDDSRSLSVHTGTSSPMGGIGQKKTFVSLGNNQGLSALSDRTKSQSYSKGQEDISLIKEDRSKKIKDIIKDKGGDAGVSIKDISVSFPHYSEKTIQRELNSMVSLGQIKKIGEKRWSRYQTI
ncbi:MAG: hypothetical protein RL687_464 [Candidatus Parcubacteria bacterium]|jgi:hypothetical protein